MRLSFLTTFLIVKFQKKCIENPIQHLVAQKLIKIRPSQIIQPWQFGHPETKATCLWLDGLPKLLPTENVKEQMELLPKKERNRIHFASGMTKENRSIIRSLTFSGIAKAKAKQWGESITPQGFNL